MLWITVDLLSAKFPRAAARAPDVVGDESSQLPACSSLIVGRSGGRLASIPPSIPLHTIFLFALICGKRRLRLGAPLFCCLAVCGFFSVCNCAVVTKSLQLLAAN
jgi:hypothetical protein